MIGLGTFFVSAINIFFVFLGGIATWFLVELVDIIEAALQYIQPLILPLFIMLKDWLHNLFEVCSAMINNNYDMNVFQHYQTFQYAWQDIGFLAKTVCNYLPVQDCLMLIILAYLVAYSITGIRYLLSFIPGVTA